MRTCCSPAVQGGCGASWALHVYPGKPTIPILCSQDLLLQSPEKALHEDITHMPMQGMLLLCHSGSAHPLAQLAAPCGLTRQVSACEAQR